MHPNLVKDVSVEMKAQLAASKLRKGKGSGKAQPYISITVKVPIEEDQSYLPSPNTMLRATLRDMPLVVNTIVPLPLKESSRCLIMERPILVDKEDDS